MRFSLRLTGDKMRKVTEIEIRYREDTYDWYTTTHEDSDAAYHHHGELGHQPAWLQLILDVAKAGGHFRPLDNGPPDVILWFKVDKDNNLLEITFP
jgi:hypothetical protein